MSEPSTTLPVLSAAELRAIFRDDERAIWRYQILSALLHEGHSHAEVAEQFGTTAETVRNLRISFGENGTLDSLRSRRRGAAGHLGRQTPLAQAVARELAATPDASANEIWRRVDAQLGASGVAVPRRSIYRLVERLRPPLGSARAEEEELWPPALVPALRSALPLLIVEPPIDLGRSALALQLLPNEHNELERGRVLAELLRDNLRAIGPRPGDDARDARFRPYQILLGEAQHGRTRDELQEDLAIAPATYTRAKRQGLERLAELLVLAMRLHRRAGARALPPDPPPLFGREREVQYYSLRLAGEGIALIWGLPDSGKSSLASYIAAQQQAAGVDVVWHECAGSGEDILGALFESYGEARPLPGADIAGSINELRMRLPQGGLLVLEHFERIVADPVTDVLIAALRAGTETRALQLLVCSRMLPVWAEEGSWLQLGGLPEDLARPLWSGLGGLALAPHDWPTVMQRTLGYPGLLRTLAADPSADLEGELLARATAELSPAAAGLLFDMLVSGRPHYAADDQHAGLELTPERELLLRGLVSYDAGRGAYHLHALQAANRERLLARVPDRGASSQRLAARALARSEWLNAARFLADAGQPERALEILVQHYEQFAGERESHAAVELAQALLPHLAPGPVLAITHGILGNLYAALGDDRSALAALRTAIELARVFEGVAPAHTRRWNVTAADLVLRHGDWQQAMVFAQAAMGGEQRIRDDIPPDERFTLTLLQHRIWLVAGEAERARYWLADAQMLAQIRGDDGSAAEVALAEGHHAAWRGAYAVAVPLLRAAIERLRRPGKHCDRYWATAQLARGLAAHGEFDAANELLLGEQIDAEAREHRYGVAVLAIARAELALETDAPATAEAALATAERWHDEANARHNAELALLRGRLGMHLAASDAALSHFARAISLATEPAIVDVRAAANLQLGLWFLQRGDATTAAQYAAGALRQADGAGLERLRSLAYICLARESVLRRALDQARAALDAARLPYADPLVDGERQQLEAELHAAQGETDAARRAFHASIEALRRGPSLSRRWAEQRFANFMQAHST